ncbi:MAG: metallophosphoesterase [Bacteroidota bacterium]
MTPFLRRTLLALNLLLLLALVAVTLLVRYTDGAISSPDRILLGYDEETERFQIFEFKQYDFGGVDGPYVVGDSVFTVDVRGVMLRQRLVPDSLSTPSLLVRVDNAARDSFTVRLRAEHRVSQALASMPDTLLAVSDIEGNFDAFVGLLQAHGVVDAAFDWTFGDGHLVLLGDFVDRGINVTPTLWLIYRLEQQADDAGGQVHFLLGNHEALNVQGRYGYAEPKYVRAAQAIGAGGVRSSERRIDFRRLFADDTELGRWLRAHNAVARIGDVLFAHAGLAPDLVEADLSLDAINTLVRDHLDDPDLYDAPGDNLEAHLVMSRTGPLWYRGMVRGYKEYYPRITSEALTRVLAFYEAEAIVVGHTVVDVVSSDFGGRVLRIDVKHGTERRSAATQGLLFLDGSPHRINATGAVVALSP